MKKWLLHIMFVSVLGMLAASCSQDADDPTQDSRTAQVVFTIALDSPSTGSRGLWGDNYDDNSNNDYESAIGAEFDNYINPSQFFVKLTLGGTTYDVQNIAYWQTSQQNVYEFVGDVNVPIDGTATYEGAKIQVYANMNPADDSFTTNYVTNPGTGVAYIPMWGVQTVNLSLTPGTLTELSDPIYLLRAMAKVEVNLSAPDYTLTNVSLNKYNTTGNSLPSGAATTANTKALHYDDNETGYCFNPNTIGAATNLAFTVTDNHLVFYLPEVENNATDELKMTVTLKKGEETVTLQAPYLYFRQYTNGKVEGDTPFDVVRNHWYQYNITAINNGEDLALTLEVQDWDVFSEEIEFTEDVTISNSGRMTYAENVNVKENTDDASILYINGCIDAETALEFNFKIDTPSGATWYASFEGDKDAFAFIDEDENRLIDANGNSSVTGNVGEEATLRIITTEANVSEMKSVTLRIVVITMDRRTIVVNDKLMPDELNESSYYTIRQNLEVAN